METIHMKTVDPVSQQLLRLAAGQGLELNWERYERLQPQDGFLRLGLSCPFGCMHGPCRVDPFGRWALRGICGLDRDGMAAAFLLRLCLNGVLEALAAGAATDKGWLPVWPDALRPLVAAALEKLGGGPHRPSEPFEAAALLQRPGQTPEVMIQRSLRLGILALGAAHTVAADAGPAETGVCRAGYGLLGGDAAVIGTAGKLPPNSVKDLFEATQADGSGIRMLSLGDWVPVDGGYLPMAGSSGEAELLLSSGLISLLWCGPGADPSLPALCRDLGIPVVFADPPTAAEDLMASALKARQSGSRPAFTPDEAPVGEGRVMLTAGALAAEIERYPERQIAVLGGWDSPQQPLGWIPTEVAPVISDEKMLVAGWGDAALWMVKRGLCSSSAVSHPVCVLDARQGPLMVLAAAAASGRPAAVRGVCYTGLRGCSDLAVGVGVAALGVPVCFATPLPLWGSRRVIDGLEHTIRELGGVLTHFDQPAGADAVLEWFNRK
jgi:hypothetical protein